MPGWFNVAILIVLSAAFAAAADGGPGIDRFLQDHCLRCHDAKKQKGDLRLDQLGRNFAQAADAERWAEVMTRINAHEMPPEDEPQPTSAAIGSVVDWIANRLAEGQAARMASRAPVTHYRMSREEYANTIYDLLGVHYDVNLPGAFAEDPRWHGFERIGALLSLSPSHVERYFTAAETVLERAFPAEEIPSRTYRADAVELRHRNERAKLTELGIADRVRGVVWPGHKLPALRGYFYGSPSKPGMYRARIRLSGLQPPGGRPPHLSIWHTQLKRTIFDQDVIAPEGQPVTVEFETFLSPPVELDFYNAVAGTIREGHTQNVLVSGRNYFISSKDRRFLDPTGYKLTDDQERPLHPLLLIDWIEWEGPLTTDADRAKRAGLMPTTADDAAVRASLQLLAERAWRRPVTPAEIAPYSGIVQSELKAGENLRSAMLAAMTGVLTSKNFFYLSEGSPTKARPRVDDHEVASRLSYLLWGSLPDEPLLAAARAGTLLQPAQRRSQFARMIADPRIARFTESFPRQWLQLHRVGSFPPNPTLYPDYDLWLERSAVMEATAYFAEVFARDLPLREFLHSDWTMVNPRLALHYGLPAGEAAGMKRVSLRPEDRRGGLLTMAAVLSMTSDGTRHRPVHRGVWVSETIFAKTPPPPPPNVEPLPATTKEQPKATIRGQLQAHATHAACAACHRRIDPLGFAFDHYDAVGSWRTTETGQPGTGVNPPVDASGTLPDGRTFTGPEAFKALLVADENRFARAFVEHLATFALRRVMTVDDAKHLDAIAAAAKADGYRLRSVIRHFVLSDFFLQR